MAPIAATADGRRLTVRTILLALATLALAAGVAAVQSSVTDAVLRGLLMVALVPCAVIDLEQRIIPNRITGPSAVIGLAVGLALDPGGEPARLLWTALTAGFLLLGALARPSGMGMGDVKLMGVIGLFLGRASIVALAVALVANLLTGVVLATRVGVNRARKTALPFGPYLALGGLVAAFVGDPIIHAYLHLHR